MTRSSIHCPPNSLARRFPTIRSAITALRFRQSASVNFATVHPKDIDISKLTELDLNIYTTELFKLPAGGVGLAFGAQFRRETSSRIRIN